MTPHRPTLLIFTLGASYEARRRRLLPASHERLERRLHQALLDNALDAGRDAGCLLEVATPLDLDLPADAHQSPQQGSSFGDRLARAWQAAFEAHGGPLLLVGSDLPGLTARPLRRAQALLAEDPERVVLGPSPDGGFYLLAAARPLGDALDAVCWCNRHTLRTLRRALEHAGRPVVLLAPLADLDQRRDLERWLAQSSPEDLHWLALRDALGRALLALRRVPWSRTSPSVRRRARRAVPSRAPPHAA